jgi:DNA repair protein RadC
VGSVGRAVAPQIGGLNRGIRFLPQLKAGGTHQMQASNLKTVKGASGADTAGQKVVLKLRPRIKGIGLYVRSSSEAFDGPDKDIAESAIECFMVLFMNPKNEIIKQEIHSVGTFDSSAVYPREIMREALLCDSSALIFIHNHPSGDPEPSLCDREITRELVFGADFLQIKVLDHVIVGGNRFYSFADHGLIEEYDLNFISLRR